MRIDRVKLITEMAKREMKISELADKAGVSRNTVSSVRSGKACSEDSACRIAAALGVDVSEIIEQK